MKCSVKFSLAFATVATLLGLGVAGASAARAEEKKPNILVIMGDDIGWFNLGSYNSGIMLNATPNLDKLDQPQGWIGPTVYPNMLKLTNLRQDPFERMNWAANGFTQGSIAYWDSIKHEMWRFQIPGQIIAKYLPSFIEYPPMQAGANFSIQDLKEKVEAAQKAAHAGQE
jgi:hypothetical protein